MVRFKYWLFATILVIISISFAAPQPAVVPSQRHWTVNVKYEHPQQIEFQVRGRSEPLRFWYVIISLTNKTKQDVHFYPKCELMTNTLQVIPAGKETPESVFLAIKKRHRRKYRFLEPLERADHRILQGADNAKDIAIIWPDFDPKAKTIKIFIAGLSNETAVVNHPVEKDKDGKPIKVFLRKTLELTYEIQGDPVFRSDARLLYKGQRWIMR